MKKALTCQERQIDSDAELAARLADRASCVHDEDAARQLAQQFGTEPTVMFNAKLYQGGLKEWWNNVEKTPFKYIPGSTSIYNELRDFFPPDLTHITLSDIKPTLSQHFERELAGFLFHYALVNVSLDHVDGIDSLFSDKYHQKLEQVLSRNQNFSHKTPLITINLGGSALGLGSGFMIAPKSLALAARNGIAFGWTALLLLAGNVANQLREQARLRSLNTFLHRPLSDEQKAEEGINEHTALIPQPSEAPLISEQWLEQYRQAFPHANFSATDFDGIPTQALKNVCDTLRRKCHSDEAREAFDNGVTATLSWSPTVCWAHASRNQPEAYYAGGMLAYDDKAAKRLVSHLK